MLKKDLRILTQEELINVFKELNQPAFRAKQVYDWLWNKGVHDIDAMTNLSLDLRTLLKENFYHLSSRKSYRTSQ